VARIRGWGAVNMKRVAELTACGTMQSAGWKAFAAREESRSAVYVFEQNEIQFTAVQEKRFRGKRMAWKNLYSGATWYRKTATWWVVSAKKEETKERRFKKLVENLQKGEVLPQMDRNPKAGSA